ncbi:MAG: CARDB domain-containing protein [Candidatus Lustribacter sp.]
MRAFVWMLRCLAGCAVAFAVAAAPAIPQTIPQVPAPTLISPLLNVGVPVLFQWTPVNPGNVYNFILQSKNRSIQQAPGPLVVTYELQISDFPDVASHILVDLKTPVTIYSFQNQNVPGSGFTNQQPPNLPLSGGTYYWRVRAIVGTAATTSYSSIGRFVLSLGGGASTPVHDMGITSLVLTTPAYVGAATVIVASVQDSGTFPEENVPLVITANGVQLARLLVPPMTAGQTQRVTTIWTPTARGIAQISALLDFSGPNQNRKVASISPNVREQPSFVTSLAGTLGLGPKGYFLADSRGRETALVLEAPNTQIDFGAFLGKAIVIRGTLSKRDNAFELAANQVSLAP